MRAVRALSAAFDNRGFKRTFAQKLFNPNQPHTLFWRVFVVSDRDTFGTYVALAQSDSFTGTDYWVCFHEGVANPRWGIGHEGADAFHADTVVENRWYNQAFRRFQLANGTWEHEYYFDLPNLSKVVTINPGAGFGSITLASVHQLTFGFVGYSDQEGLDGIFADPVAWLTKVPKEALARYARYWDPLPQYKRFIWSSSPGICHTDLRDKSPRGNHWQANGAITSTVGPADIVVRRYRRPVLVPETASGTIYTRTLSDSVVVTDDQEPIRSVQANRIIPEAMVGLVESLIRSQTHGRITHDDLSTSDLASKSITLGRITNDVINVADAVVKSMTHGRITHDDASATDLALRYALLFRRLIDTTSVTDNLLVTVTDGSAVIVQRVLHDDLDIRDVCMRSVQMYRLAHENAETQETTLRSVERQRWCVDTLAIADSVARGLIVSRRTVDVAEAADVAIRYTLLYRLLTDSVDATDTLASQISFFQQFIGRVLMFLESTEFTLMQLEDSAIEMGAEVEHIVLELTDQ